MSRLIDADSIYPWYMDAFDFDPNEVRFSMKDIRENLDNIPTHEPQKWIPCSERLPKYGHVVLWCNEYGSVFTSAITGNIGYSWHIGRKHWGADVVAWMPLPEPWKGEEE